MEQLTPSKLRWLSFHLLQDFWGTQTATAHQLSCSNSPVFFSVFGNLQRIRGTKVFLLSSPLTEEHGFATILKHCWRGWQLNCSKLDQDLEYSKWTYTPVPQDLMKFMNLFGNSLSMPIAQTFIIVAFPSLEGSFDISKLYAYLKTSHHLIVGIGKSALSWCYWWVITHNNKH